MIYANGLPKSGTHLLMTWLASTGHREIHGTVKGYGPELRGLRVGGKGDYIHAHVTSDHDLPGRVITVFRNPRDTLVSYARWRPEPNICKAIDNYLGNRPFVDMHRAFRGWTRTETVTFDWLLKNCAKRQSATWSGNISQWGASPLWTKAVEEHYIAAGGGELDDWWAGFIA